MKSILTAVALCTILAPVIVHAETVWRWTDANGALHYSNERAVAPASAVTVTTELARAVRVPAEVPVGTTRETAAVDDATLGIAPSEARPVRKQLRRIYDEERLRFGCYSGDVLQSGGWAHGDDIASSSIGCYRYLLGPDAWLNAARAELAVRANGINPRELYRLYRSAR